MIELTKCIQWRFPQIWHHTVLRKAWLSRFGWIVRSHLLLIKLFHFLNRLRGFIPELFNIGYGRAPLLHLVRDHIHCLFMYLILRPIPLVSAGLHSLQIQLLQARLPGQLPVALRRLAHFLFSRSLLPRPLPCWAHLIIQLRRVG